MDNQTPHPNLDRVLTLVVKIKDPSPAQTIWEAHIHKDVRMAGCDVLAISEGDQLRERDLLEEFSETMVDDEGPTFEEWKEEKYGHKRT